MDFSLLKLAASGIRVQQTRVDFVGHNLANTQTFGFRAVRPEIVDLPPDSATFGVPGTTYLVQTGDPTSGAFDVRETRADLAGPILSTGSPLDVALPQGVFLSVKTPDGQTALTRDGHLNVTADGTIQAGIYPLATGLRVPAGTLQAGIDSAGQIHAVGPAGDQIVGALPLVRIPNPEELQALGDGLAQVTIDSGAAQPTVPSDLVGLSPQAVEGSNVQVDQELTHMMRAQRAYQANAQMIHTWDELANQTIQEMGRA